LDVVIPVKGFVVVDLAKLGTGTGAVETVTVCAVGTL
jgi:hypothetical protein